MSRLPVSRDGSIQRLLDEGYTIYRRDGFIVCVVPYLGRDGQPREGLLVDVLNIAADGIVDNPPNHQMYFVGEQPYRIDGSPLLLGGSSGQFPLFDDKIASFHWSWKLKDASGQLRDYGSLYEKFISYAGEVAGPPLYTHPGFTVTPYSDALNAEDKGPFPYVDTHAARTNTSYLKERIAEDVIAIIGVGGTGSYVADILSKSGVREIRLFDGDRFDVHNAFRAPGVAEREELGQPKAEVFADRYKRWHSGVTGKAAPIEEETFPLLDGVTFAFVCVDSVAARRAIALHLMDRRIAFIDAGMGLERADAGLVGLVRVTIAEPATYEKARQELANELHRDIEDEYASNVQTAELNALNAAAAVLAYKRLRHYYAENPKIFQWILTTQTMQADRFYA